jgi:ABC-type dipeptide/oligopeptide/nickel transport system ATPase component
VTLSSSVATTSGESIRSNSPNKITALLEVKDLYIDFFTHAGIVKGLSGVSLSVRPGEMSAIVGESGAGKSVLAWSILGLTRAPGRVVGGEILWRGENLLSANEQRLNAIRGKEISLIVSNPRSHLHPLTTVGKQIEAVSVGDDNAHEVRQATLAALRDVEMPDPLRVYQSYPHELSGGMAQRVLIAMALINSPQLVIADDATSALDVTVQRQVLDLMSNLIGRSNASALMITHDFGVVAQYCKRAIVMFGGEIYEAAETQQLFENPLHSYTQALLASARRRRSEAVANRSEIGSRTRSIDPSSYLVEEEPDHWVRRSRSDDVPEVSKVRGGRP